MTKGGLKKMLCQVSLKTDQDPKDSGGELIRFRSIFIEAGFVVKHSDLVDQADCTTWIQ
jgi:hypothetical protein